MNPELTRQFGDRPIPLDRRQRHLGLARPVVLLACPLHVLLPRHRRFLGAGLHLSQLSHFRGPAHGTAATEGGSPASGKPKNRKLTGPHEMKTPKHTERSLQLLVRLAEW